MIQLGKARSVHLSLTILAGFLANAGSSAVPSAQPPTQQKTVPDNGGAGAEAALPPITVQVTGDPIVYLLPTLSRPEGPRLTAVHELGERRVHVLVKELPQPRLRKALAEVVSGVWLRKERGATLQLEPDPAALRERETLLAQRKQRFFTGLRNLVKQLSLDPEGLERLRKTEPTSAGYLSNPASRAAIQLTALLGEKLWQELEATGRLTIPPEQLGAQGTALLKEYAQRMNAFQEEARKTITYDPLPPSPPLDPEQTSRQPLQFLVDGQRFGLAREPYRFLSVDLSTGLSFGREGLVGSGMTITGSQEANQPSCRWDPATASTAARSPAEPRVVLTFKKPPAGWGDLLRAAAETLHLQVVSEEFTRQFPPQLPLDVKGQLSGTLPEILDRVCELYGYQWRVKEGIYEFRSSRWYVDREQEPPGTLVKAAQMAREQRRPLSLEWLGQAAAAVPPGPASLLWVHAPAAMPIMMRFRPLLQLYGSLSPEQQAALGQESGLAEEGLTPPQRALLQVALQQLGPRNGTAIGPASQIRVRLAHEANTARFTLLVDGNAIEADVPLPSSP